MLFINGRQTIEPGCFIDGHHGHYVLPMSIRLAMRHGFCPAFPSVESLVERYDNEWHEFSPQDFEALTETSDDALEYLTGITEGGYWEWVDGELFLTADDDEVHYSRHCGQCGQDRDYEFTGPCNECTRSNEP